MQVNPAVVVVPPFQCAWLTDPEYILHGGRGCLTFEVRGDNDVTVLLKQQPGSRRWQHLSAAAGSNLESNYTVILGSHRNSCLKIEKDGVLCCSVNDVAVARLPSQAFMRCWINFDRGCITVGLGDPGTNVSHTWRDPDPIESISYAGLSAWDTHIVYRAIRVLPVLNVQQGTDLKSTQLPSLLDLACNTLRDCLRPSSVSAVLVVVDALEPTLPVLRQAALSFAAEHLQEALAQDPEGVAGLPAPMLSEVLRSQAMSCGEMLVFKVITVWAAARGGPEATPDLDILLPHVRFPLMTLEELDCVQQHPLWETCSMLRQLVREAHEANTAMGSPEKLVSSLQAAGPPRLPSRQEAALSARFLSRTTPGCVELLFVCPGDKNGVTYWLATQGGQQQWVNPMLSGRVKVQASSPACRSTNPASCVALGPPRLNFAAPRSEAGRLVSWWSLDLGPRHQLACSAYTLRHDKSHDPLRSWTLQASRDGPQCGWEDLRRHENDLTLRLPGQYGSWAVTGHAATVPYRCFRICVMQMQKGNENPWHASLAQIELYGNLYVDGKEEDADVWELAGVAANGLG
uniref:BACK domain-containing protein n=2 Tax=Auxenochlorella protothecoides TaxID=3075 RepID=A0A1D2AD73_AUXPR